LKNAADRHHAQRHAHTLQFLRDPAELRHVAGELRVERRELAEIFGPTKDWAMTISPTKSSRPSSLVVSTFTMPPDCGALARLASAASAAAGLTRLVSTATAAAA